MDEAENKWEHMKSDDFQNSGGLYEEILEKSRPNDHLFFLAAKKCITQNVPQAEDEKFA